MKKTIKDSSGHVTGKAGNGRKKFSAAKTGLGSGKGDEHGGPGHGQQARIQELKMVF